MLAIQRLFLWLLIHLPPLEGLSLTTLGQASTVICVYPAWLCRNLLVEMVCFRIGNDIASQWQEWPSLLCILTFFFFFFNWWMVQHVSMSPWLFVAKLYIMCGFNSAWKIISLYVAVHYMYIICDVSVSALNPWYCNGIPTLLNVFDMLVTVCDLNFFFSFSLLWLCASFYKKLLETGSSENYWAMFVMQVYLGSM